MTRIDVSKSDEYRDLKQLHMRVLSLLESPFTGVRKIHTSSSTPKTDEIMIKRRKPSGFSRVSDRSRHGLVRNFHEA